MDTPRDRNGRFEPQIAPEGVRWLERLDKIVPGLHAKGITARDTQPYVAEICDVEVSPDLISKIADAVHAEVADWQMRPLDSVYPLIFLRALVCKVREDGSVRNKAAHLAVGVDHEGRKQVLGMWSEPNEEARGCTA